MDAAFDPGVTAHGHDFDGMSDDEMLARAELAVAATSKDPAATIINAHLHRCMEQVKKDVLDLKAQIASLPQLVAEAMEQRAISQMRWWTTRAQFMRSLIVPIASTVAAIASTAAACAEAWRLFHH